MQTGENSGEGKAPILVVGGGIAGITAAVEAAEAGCEVVLIEKFAYLGGRVAGFHQYFPKLCPPPCGLEINFRRIKNNPRIKVYTLAELETLNGSPGHYDATIRISPRYVTERCTACGECSIACPAVTSDPFNFGLTSGKAIRPPHREAYPAQYFIARDACWGACHACVDVCKYAAIDLHQKTEHKTIRVSSVILATGWAPYDATKIDNLGFGKYVNVVNNVMLERMAVPDGPTRGKILRPSDGKAPRAIAFVQCAGSRDQNHLSYCSGVCCTASLKQASYLRAQYPNAKITIFYIDLRTPGHLQDFADMVISSCKIELIKGKIGRVQEHPATRDLLVTAEDILGRRKISREYDLLILAVGMVPQTAALPVNVDLDEFGFAANLNPGIHAAGCAKRPAEVAASIRDATGAALKAMQDFVHVGRGTASHD